MDFVTNSTEIELRTRSTEEDVYGSVVFMDLAFTLCPHRSQGR
jgi:hypothetical protein